ncbi:MAG: hypothetical protein LBQ70_01665, partial [Prevotellaceae bacterium]|nr:hypothetical protein [Prevotellaceae bacterium]
MINKTFSCKIEDLPVIGEFLLGSLTKDLSDFSAYSPMFTADYPASIRVKIDACKNLISSSTITRELKATTQALYGKSKNLRGKLNTLEGYLKLAGQELDVAVDDTGLKSVRNDISRHNTEGLELNLRRMLTAVKRNMEVLTAKGLRRELIDEIEVRLEEIGELNVKQNVQTSERNRLTQSNIE